MATSRTTVPPNAIDAERVVLGAILLDADVLYTVMEILPPPTAWFYDRNHGLIYDAMLTLNEQQREPELHLVADVLNRRRHLEKVGGSTYLATLMEQVTTTAGVRHHAQLVREKALLRSVINLGTTLQADGFEQKELSEIIGEAQQTILTLAGQQHTDTASTLHDLIRDAVLQAEGATGETMTGMSTGFHDLDRLTNGFHASDLVILAARPGVGKTSLALQFALRVAQDRPQQQVMVFSLEMSKAQLAQRLLCSESRIDSMRLRRGLVSNGEWGRIMEVASRLGSLPVLVDDTPSLTTIDIRARAKRVQHERGLSLLVVDYLQLLHWHRRIESRVQEVSEISRDLKILAKELNVPVIALSQLNRSVESRSPAIPQLSDLRESGSIEQDADMILFIYRADMYDHHADPVAQLIIAKQRNGPLGEVRLAFHREYARFDALADPAHYAA